MANVQCKHCGAIYSAYGDDKGHSCEGTRRELDKFGFRTVTLEEMRAYKSGDLAASMYTKRQRDAIKTQVETDAEKFESFMNLCEQGDHIPSLRHIFWALWYAIRAKFKRRE
jgi:hypothetical protein